MTAALFFKFVAIDFMYHGLSLILDVVLFFLLLFFDFVTMVQMKEMSVYILDDDARGS